MRKSLMLIPTVLLLASCNAVDDVNGPSHEPDIQPSVTERCDPPRFEVDGECLNRRGPKPPLEPF